MACSCYKQSISINNSGVGGDHGVTPGIWTGVLTFCLNCYIFLRFQMPKLVYISRGGQVSTFSLKYKQILVFSMAKFVVESKNVIIFAVRRLLGLVLWQNTKWPSKYTFLGPNEQYCYYNLIWNQFFYVF